MRGLCKGIKGYIAGFLDADGSIYGHIEKSKTCKYGFYIRVSIDFSQKETRHEVIEWLHTILNVGNVSDNCKRADGMSKLTIRDVDSVKEFLLQFKDSLILKKKNAELGLQILEKKRKIKSEKDLIEVCKLVDQISELNYSKTKKLTSEFVIKALTKK